MRARRLLPVVLVFAVACVGGATGPGTATDSGIDIVTVSGPQCPVEVAGSPCPDAPISVELFINKRGSNERVLTIRTDDRGESRVVIAPGEYTIAPASPGPPSASPVDVTVRPHTFTRVRIEFDTGIR